MPTTEEKNTRLEIKIIRSDIFESIEDEELCLSIHLTWFKNEVELFNYKRINDYPELRENSDPEEDYEDDVSNMINSQLLIYSPDRPKEKTKIPSWIPRFLKRGILKIEEDYKNFLDQDTKITFTIELKNKEWFWGNVFLDDLNELLKEIWLATAISEFCIINLDPVSSKKIAYLNIHSQLDKIELEWLDIGVIRISSLLKEKLISLWNCSFKNCFFWEVYFDEIKFDNYINFNECHFRSKLSLRAIEVNNVTWWLSFEDCYFNENASLRLSQSNIHRINLIRSSCEDIQILDSQIKKAFVYQTSLEKMRCINMTWGGFYNLEKTSAISPYQNPSIHELRESYRQLKYAHDNIWNKIEANKFFGKELEIYGNSLAWWGNFGEKLVYFINKSTSNFWNTWWKPLGWLMLFSLVTSYYTWSIYQNKPQCWPEFFTIWLSYISILDFKDLEKTWFNLIYSVIYWFLSYQLIVSLRRLTNR